MDQHHDKELDARGLNCPLPILRTKKALNDLVTGQILKVVATDPGAVKDFQAFAKQSGNALVQHGEEGGEFFFYLRRK
jgi:tRNA 2-thiouridine synthesizing protein A